MPLISVAAAMTLTDWSESTFRRRFADGTLTRSLEQGGSGRVMVDWDELRPLLAVVWRDVDVPTLVDADGGVGAAQREVGLMLLEADHPKGAVYWLEQATKRQDAEAAHWLSRLHLLGTGVERDDAKALHWLAQAAELGHPIASRQIRELAGG